MVGSRFATRPAPTAALFQATAAAPPSPTATATPTPIVYLIEAGDTLLAIALERGTSVEAIMALNPGVRPELLQIGQAITLPPPATPVFAGERATPVPLQVVVRDVQLYGTPLGDAWLLGEVENLAPVPAENVQVAVTLRDRAGVARQTAAAWVVPAVLAPGNRAPFGVLVPGPTGDLTASEVAISGGQSVVDLGNRYLDLDVVDVEATLGEASADFQGRVANQGPDLVAALVIVVTLYDAQGKVTGFGLARHSAPLLPGALQRFSLQVAPPGAPAVDYRVTAQGLRAAD